MFLMNALQEARASSVSYIIIIPPATRLLGCIGDNYSTIDCQGGAITAFPVTVLGLELHHAGDPSNSNFKGR